MSMNEFDKFDELLELRASTAQLFGEKLREAGYTEEAVQAAKALYMADPAAAETMLLGSSEFVTAANPWGCNQYGHRKGHQGGATSKKELSMSDANAAFKKAEKEYGDARKKVWDLDAEIENAQKSGDTERADKLKNEQKKARDEWQKKRDAFKKAEKDYGDAARRRMQEKRGGDKKAGLSKDDADLSMESPAVKPAERPKERAGSSARGELEHRALVGSLADRFAKAEKEGRVQQRYGANKAELDRLGLQYDKQELEDYNQRTAKLDAEIAEWYKKRKEKQQ